MLCVRVHHEQCRIYCPSCGLAHLFWQRSKNPNCFDASKVGFQRKPPDYAVYYSCAHVSRRDHLSLLVTSCPSRVLLSKIDVIKSLRKTVICGRHVLSLEATMQFPAIMSTEQSAAEAASVLREKLVPRRPVGIPSTMTAFCQL